MLLIRSIPSNFSRKNIISPVADGNTAFSNVPDKISIEDNIKGLRIWRV
jgi:hypothetical protein